MAPEHVAFWQREAQRLTAISLEEKIVRDQRDFQTDVQEQYPELHAFAVARLPILLAEQERRHEAS